MTDDVGRAIDADGRLESVSGGVVVGWAWDRSTPESRVTVRVIVDGGVVATATADLLDRSLIKAGIGDGEHGFRIALPDGLADGGRHLVAVRVAGDDIGMLRPIQAFNGATEDGSSRWSETRFVPAAPSDLVSARTDPSRLRRTVAGIALSRLQADLLFVALVVIGAMLVFVEMRGLSFFGDDWDFLINRRGLSAAVLLEPAGPHLSLVPVLVFKAMLQVFGMGSFAPWKAMTALDMALLAGAVGLACRRSLGPIWALVPVALMVTLGPGAETLLWPFQVGYAIATVAGILALVSVARDTRRGDAVGCAALCLSLASASQGIGAVVGSAVMIALGPDRRRRAWVLLVPAALYGLWYLRYGAQASETHVSYWTHAPAYVFHALSTTLAALVGLSRLHLTGNTAPLDDTFGAPLAAISLIALAGRLWRGWRPSRLFWGAASALLVLWVAACLSNVNGNRLPNSERYVPTDAALLLICLCEAIPRPRLGPAATVAVGVVLLAICLENVAVFADGRQGLVHRATASRSTLGALLIARKVVDKGMRLPGGQAALNEIRAGPFLSAADSFGTNAYTLGQLHSASNSDRHLADSLLVAAERLALTQEPGKSAAARTAPPQPSIGHGRTVGPCLELGGQFSAVATRAPAVTIQSANAPLSIGVSRLADGPTSLGTVPAGRTVTLRIPADRARSVSWLVWIRGPAAKICSAA